MVFRALLAFLACLSKPTLAGRGEHNKHLFDSCGKVSYPRCTFAIAYSFDRTVVRLEQRYARTAVRDREGVAWLMKRAW